MERIIYKELIIYVSQLVNLVKFKTTSNFCPLATDSKPGGNRRFSSPPPHSAPHGWSSTQPPSIASILPLSVIHAISKCSAALPVCSNSKSRWVLAGEFADHLAGAIGDCHLKIFGQVVMHSCCLEIFLDPKLFKIFKTKLPSSTPSYAFPIHLVAVDLSKANPLKL